MSHSGSSQNFSVTGRQPGSRGFDGPADGSNNNGGDDGYAWAHQPQQQHQPRRGPRKGRAGEGGGGGGGSMGRLAQLGASNLKLGQEFPADELFSEDPVHDLTASFSLKLPSRAKMSHVSHSPGGGGPGGPGGTGKAQHQASSSAAGFRSSPAASKGGDDILGGSGGGNGNEGGGMALRAAKGYHIKTSKNTWETVGRMKSPLERPITRKEVEALDARFTAAMSHIEAGGSGGGGMSGGGSGGDGAGREVNPVFEQDLMEIQSEIGALYAPLEDKHGEQEKTMARCLFKQKWTDLIFGELSDQLNVTCLEQGVLLQKIRVQNAQICEEFRRCHDSGVAELKDRERLMRNLRVQLADIKQKHEHLEKNFEQKQAVAIAKVTAEKDDEIEKVHEDLRAQEENCDQLHTSLKTLNSLFNTMRDNQEGLRIGDLREANSRLQALLTHRDKELEALRPLKAQCATLEETVATQSDELEKLRETLIITTNKLNEQQALNKELMSKEEYRLESLEKMLVGAKEDMALDPEGTQERFNRVADTMTPIKSGGVGGGGGDSRPSTTGSTAERKSPGTAGSDSKPGPPRQGQQQQQQQQQGRRGSGGNGGGGGDDQHDDQVLCVRCKRTLKAARNLDMFDDHLGQKKLLCESFRILLPNLMGQRPERSREWMLRCMRAMVFAKQREASAAERASRSPVRLPEFVYGWFFPRIQTLARGDRESMIAEAEENMWGFYYTLKRDAKVLPECRLFFTMLNETYGEDDLSFFLYCMQTVRGVARDDVQEAWGEEVISSDDFATILELEDKMGGLVEITERVWISVESAMYTIERVMTRSTERDRDRVIKDVAEHAEPSDGRLGEDAEKDPDMKCVDSAYVVQLLMAEYRKEQAVRKASLKVMFETASVAALSNSAAPENRTSHGKTLDMQQFIEVVRSINSNSRIEVVATLYRDAYDFSNIGGVDLHAFLFAANKNHFFTSCQRLPTYYGAQNAELLSPNDAMNLRFVLIRHIRMFAGFITEATELIGPKRAARIHYLHSVLEDDLAGTVDGEGPDPQRLLFGFRRLLDALMAIRIERLENYGEKAPDKKLVFSVDKELGAIEEILALSGFNTGRTSTVTSRMKQLLLKLSATKIQRSWKRRLEEHPVPLHMRRLMSREYASSGHPLEGVSDTRRIVRPLPWALLLIREILSQRYEELLSGVAPTSAASFPRYIYNFMVNKFGGFHLAELHLHDLFTTSWACQKQQALCRLFLIFATEGASVKKPEYGDPEALLFILKAAGALAGPDSPHLFPFPDSLETCAITVSIQAVSSAINVVFPKHVQAALLARIKLISSEFVDLDNCLFVFAETWLSELRGVQARIGVLLDDSGGGGGGGADGDVIADDGGGAGVSLDTFNEFVAAMERVASHLGLDAKVLEDVTIDLYIEGMRLAKARGMSKVETVLWACRRRRFVYWDVSVDALTAFPPSPRPQFALLDLTWDALHEPAEALISDFTSLVEVGRAVELDAKQVTGLRQVFNEFTNDVERVRSVIELGDPDDVTLAQMDRCWQGFRNTMAKLQLCHKLAGLGGTIKDAYDMAHSV